MAAIGFVCTLGVAAKVSTPVSSSAICTPKTAASKRSPIAEQKRVFLGSSDDFSFFKGNALAATVSSASTGFSASPSTFSIRSDYAWYNVLPGSALAPGEKTNVFVKFKSGEGSGLDVLVVRDFDGNVFAVSNVCPHLGTPLHTGKITADGAIVCSQHRSAWSLNTGEVKGEWCPFPPVLGKITGALQPPAPLLTYGAREVAGQIEVYLNLDAKKNLETKTYGSYFRGEAY
uniref:Rieske domain-containing protein n=1 Tax=Cyanoptyche gloeocystis TaxID=77922 RepID=A0A7S2JLW8_9EUKA|mmetsp:Transcript_1217/g.2333  ORF Transcript_1217/g.2333 Transcript_1217/m.2333 type:complete len:231 (+) Transcript_1217:110-802(+)|eukprot:CAMPEP_0196666382 /NCGR_PEP_ID=MMETSP1086-20130531/64478_1 /TAXON_ID=77921 /ORGANISM="Cyanoptyche  gloeocystis , Strain SAG4.97" /LENGTH=230 /DNA_ID=CAMNT_0042003567 /DNA_START=668 /DNA_END=1360 /DNA_ORIENTATION=-